MLDLRLIPIFLLFVCGGYAAETIPYLKHSEIDAFISKNETVLIGYVGFPECEYTKEFIDQMNVVYDELSSKNISVGIVNEIDHSEHGPYLKLYRKGRDPIRIDGLSDGLEIAIWVQIKTKSPIVYTLNTKAEYDYLVMRFKTVFSAYLTDPRKIDAYTKVADQELNTLFVHTSNLTLANEAFSYSNQEGIFVDHKWFDYENYSYPCKKPCPYEGDFSQQSIKNWVRKEVYKTAKELNPQNIKWAFNFESNYMSIFFLPRSDANFTQLVAQKFTDIHTHRGDRKFALFFVDTDLKSNLPLLEKFHIKQGEKMIVMFNKHYPLGKNPFTKQCKDGFKWDSTYAKKEFALESCLEDYENYLNMHT